MKVKIIEGGGYQGTTLDVDAVPRIGETVNLGNGQGTVAQVIHIPSSYRDSGKAAESVNLNEAPSGGPY